MPRSIRARRVHQRLHVGRGERDLVVAGVGEAQQPPQLGGDLEGDVGPLRDLDPGQAGRLPEEERLDDLERPGEVLRLLVGARAVGHFTRDSDTACTFSWNDGISFIRARMSSLVKWMAWRGVRETMEAVRSE